MRVSDERIITLLNQGFDFEITILALDLRDARKELAAARDACKAVADNAIREKLGNSMLITNDDYDRIRVVAKGGE